MLTKVDRIATIQEAENLVNEGVSIICVTELENPSFNDNRTLSSKDCLGLLRQVKGTKKCLEIDLERDFMATIKVDEIDFFQISLRQESLIEENIDKIRAFSHKIILTDAIASYEDDPNWIRDRLNIGVTCKLNQLSLLPDVKNSWSFIKNECPKFSEELQVADIAEIVQSFPTLVTMDLKTSDITDICSSLNELAGFYWVLGEEATHSDKHFTNNLRQIGEFVAALWQR